MSDTSATPSRPLLAPFPMDWSRCLAVVAHPDDLEYGAAAEVGVSAVEFLDHPDGTIVYSVELRRDIARAIRHHRPDILAIGNHHPTWGPGIPNQADHIAVGHAALDAVPDAANRWIHRELLDEGLEPWAGVRFAAVGGSPEPTHAVDIGATLGRGIASLRAHRAYLDGLGSSSMSDPGTFLRSMAEAAGAAAGCELACTFELIDL